MEQIKTRFMIGLYNFFLGQCLRFYYHMYGVGTGDLSVLLVSNDRSSSSQIWFETGNNGNQWKNAKVTITSDFSFRVRVMFLNV